jgi:hypothetical protein
MKTIKKEVIDMTCGYDYIYDVNHMQIKITEELLTEIKNCWDYLENKNKQIIQITIHPDKLQFSTDVEDFDDAVYYVLINVKGDRTIYLECCDSLITKYFSDSITELELIESIKSSNA